MERYCIIIAIIHLRTNIQTKDAHAYSPATNFANTADCRAVVYLYYDSQYNF